MAGVFTKHDGPHTQEEDACQCACTTKIHTHFGGPLNSNTHDHGRHPNQRSRQEGKGILHPHPPGSPRVLPQGLPPVRLGPQKPPQQGLQPSGWSHRHARLRPRLLPRSHDRPGARGPDHPAPRPVCRLSHAHPRHSALRHSSLHDESHRAACLRWHLNDQPDGRMGRRDRRQEGQIRPPRL